MQSVTGTKTEKPETSEKLAFVEAEAPPTETIVMTPRSVALCPLAWTFEDGHRSKATTHKKEKHAFIEAEAS